MKHLSSINPTNNSLIGEMPASTPDEIKAKVNTARATAKSWKMLGVQKRLDILRPLVEIFSSNQTMIAHLTTQEIGKPISESLGDFEGDFIYLNDFLAHGASYIADEITYQNDKAIHRIVYEPRGVVACIAPWNYPFGNFIWSVIPNLIVGNTVVFKHSEECPLTAKRLEELMLSLKDLPAGVFSAIYGDAQEGALLIEQDIDMIWFTGSSSVGRILSNIAGKKQIKAILEMGGSNPAIILDDANINEAIDRVFTGRFTNCGQVCDAIKRLLVHEHLFDTVIEGLIKRLAQIKIGDPEKSDTQLGPLVSFAQLQLLKAQVEDALSKGAVLHIGENQTQHISGAYYPPTLLTNIKNNMRVWQEEVFGPVLPVITFKTDEEAIAMANDTPYGLGALVCGKDINRARAIADKIDAGYVDINQGSHWQPSTPFGGHKTSGIGCEHGRHGFQELCQIKVIAEG